MKSACSKTMYNANRVFDAISELKAQHDDGLIHRGEFVMACMLKFEELAKWDLREARHTAESYGHDSTSFSTFMANDRKAQDDEIHGVK